MKGLRALGPQCEGRTRESGHCGVGSMQCGRLSEGF